MERRNQIYVKMTFAALAVALLLLTVAVSQEAAVENPKCKIAERQAAMMRQCRMIMGAPIYLDSPAVILGQADVLELSAEQKESLKNIVSDARKKAAKVLAPEQREKLGDVSIEPLTMMQMCQKMCGQMMAGAGKDMPGQTMCPMMQWMTQSKDKQTQTLEQTVCPVMGGKINKDVFTEYKGKKVYFCYPGCKEKFEKDPEKYIAKLPQFKQAEPAKKVEEAPAGTEQKVCPLMGGAINKALFTEYKGRKVYFCCAGCKQKFEKEPEKYLDKLPQFKD